MGERDKPFACPVSDCGMRFTNEDHLTVHKRKHDMCLSFGNAQKMNIFVADQTPTPTRFIRNCEEVGLFQDLQNVNPFEEQFKKAAEAVKSGTNTLHPEVEPMCGQADDTLHTPQVFSHIVNHAPDYQRATEKLFTPEKTHDTTENLETPVPTQNKDVQLLLRLPDGKVLQLSAVEMSETASSTSSSSNMHNSASVSSEDRSSSIILPEIVKPNPDPKSPTETPKDNMTLIKQKLKQTLTSHQLMAAANKKQENKNDDLQMRNGKILLPSNPPVNTLEGRSLLSFGEKRPKTASRVESSEEDSDVKRQKFLERNRAAASRCRQKRKDWMSTMQHRSSITHATNQQLMAEVSDLKAEVAQLKTLLLAHRDCPVTKAMCEAGVIRLLVNPVSHETEVEVQNVTHETPVINAPISISLPSVIQLVPSQNDTKEDKCEIEHVPVINETVEHHQGSPSFVFAPIPIKIIHEERTNINFKKKIIEKETVIVRNNM